jgi:hypothetical protein
VILTVPVNCAEIQSGRHFNDGSVANLKNEAHSDDLSPITPLGGNTEEPGNKRATFPAMLPFGIHLTWPLRIAKFGHDVPETVGGWTGRDSDKSLASDNCVLNSR